MEKLVKDSIEYFAIADYSDVNRVRMNAANASIIHKQREHFIVENGKIFADWLGFNFFKQVKVS